MLSISLSVSAAKLSRKLCSKMTLLVRTLVCTPDSVGISECGCLPGVNVLVDGFSEGKAAMVTSASQDILLAGSVPLYTLSNRTACSGAALVQSARTLCKSPIAPKGQWSSWAVGNAAWAAPRYGDAGRELGKAPGIAKIDDASILNRIVGICDAPQ